MTISGHAAPHDGTDPDQDHDRRVEVGRSEDVHLGTAQSADRIVEALFR